MSGKSNLSENSLELSKGFPIMSVRSGCDKCPCFEYCEKASLFSDEQRRKGCSDVKQLMVENLKLYRRPEEMILRALADLETRMQIQTLKDERDVSTEEFKLLNELKLKYLNMVMKYGKGTVHTQISLTKNMDDEIIPVDKGSYSVVKEEPERRSEGDSGESGGVGEADSETKG